MENKPADSTPISISHDEVYKGPSPWTAAMDRFVSSTVVTFVGASALTMLGFHLLCKTKFIKNYETVSWATAIGRQLKDKVMWGIAGVFGAWDARQAYKEIDSDRNQHYQLVGENHLMRQQLNQTGQILMHVAHAVEKGQLVDSTLVLDETTAPPSHVARLQTQQAAQAVSEVAPELASNAGSIIQPAARHAEAVLSEKTAAAEAAPTI